MADKEYFSKVKLPNDETEKYVKDEEARAAISNINIIAPLTVENAPQNYYQDVVIGENASTTHGYGVAIGYDAYKDENGVAIGHTAWATCDGSIAIGDNSNVNGSYSIAIGYAARTYNASRSSVAIGSYSLAQLNKEFSIGNAEKSITRRITNVTDPIYAQDGATKNYVDTKLAEIQALLNKPITWGMLKYGLAYEASTTASEEATT